MTAGRSCSALCIDAVSTWPKAVRTYAARTSWRRRPRSPSPLRFHLHPDVKASLQQDGEAVLLRLRSGGGWRLRADGARLSLEESIYLGGHQPRRSEQVVLTGYADGPQQVKWAISKVGWRALTPPVKSSRSPTSTSRSRSFCCR